VLAWSGGRQPAPDRARPRSARRVRPLGDASGVAENDPDLVFDGQGRWRPFDKDLHKPAFDLPSALGISRFGVRCRLEGRPELLAIFDRELKAHIERADLSERDRAALLGKLAR
jgi:hypothetical protein